MGFIAPNLSAFIEIVAAAKLMGVVGGFFALSKA
jgi:hypothetical protein